MIKTLAAVLVYISAILSSSAQAYYALGCGDPEYHQYIKEQFAHIETKNRRLLAETLRDYERSLTASKNLYQVIGDLSRHIKYSAQFEPINTVTAKIERIFEHADELSVEQQIAGDAIDSFSSETHSVGIARAWLAYRQDNHHLAFVELLKSIEANRSAVLSSFGPDFELIRHIYRDGHVEPVVAYIKKTEDFWIGRRPDALRYVWLKMIKAECKIQFNFIDTINALKLGLSIIDVNKDYGVSR
jgi:hypothetical protein